MATEIKAIQTEYKGYKFRSRLEARWAVFFDTLGVRWEYEPEGFELGDGVRYLPDFWLPDTRLWVEVKPDSAAAQSEIAKLRRFAELADNPLMVAVHLSLPRSPGESHYSNGAMLGKVEGAASFCWFEHLRTLYLVSKCGDQWISYNAGQFFDIDRVSSGHPNFANNQIDAAFTAARQARFEHGESPK